MSYYIDLRVPASPEPYYQVKDYSVHCSWNYTKMMMHLPCGWVRDWNHKRAKELIKPIRESIKELEQNSDKYSQYEADRSRNLGTIEHCREILQMCLDNFEECPDLEIDIS